MTDDPLRRAYHTDPHDGDDGGLSVGRRIGRIENTLTDHGRRIDAIEDWRAEVRGSISTMRAVFGISLLNVIGVAVSIYVALSGHRS